MVFLQFLLISSFIFKKTINDGEETTKHFLQELVNILLAYISKSLKRSSKVLDFHYPHQLMEDTLKYGVKTGKNKSSTIFHQLSDGLDIIGVAGEWLTSTARMFLYVYRFTYEISPVFILMEEVVLRKMHSIIGWPEEDGDGIFCPGNNTMSNLYSVLLARFHLFPAVKTHGMSVIPRLALFTSEHSHYSIKKSAAVLGIGSENVIVIRCDERGKMISSELNSSIVAGLVPFYVSATAGTTVCGTFDPLNEIVDICEHHGLLLSNKHCVKLQGIERAHSVTWNPHKMMGIPLQCSIILVKRKGLLQECNQLCAEYLFQPDKHYDVSYDTGDKSIQCGRHIDVFKLCIVLRAFEAQINHCLENAEYLYYKLKRTDFKLVFKGKVNKVNFFCCVFSNPATQREDVDFLIDEIACLACEL
uniref:Zgc:163121 n=1 Tax=Cyprinus carpio TaxID=7962 RepID=A0A8C1LNE0_CYPCA